jgi:2-polyprenyl-3-methyl-5-hydroxy-6-metoxy-1,4-benzoquinol methylase
MTETALEFTGERYTPECPREMLYEHYARYAMAKTFVADKKVLDCACGEGYGSALLAQSATSVLGVDVSQQAIQHAKQRYSRRNLQFSIGDATALALPDETFDVVVSFETLEHLSLQDQMLAEFKRVLTASGVLLISSPDKRNYSDQTGYQNEFHVKELYRDEFEALLMRHFQHHRIFAQKLVFQSMIWDLNTDPQKDLMPTRAQIQTMHADRSVSSAVPYAPMYYIAIASDDAQVVAGCARQLHLFADQAQSLYSHYQAEIRNGIYAAQVIAELRAEIARLSAAT